MHRSRLNWSKQERLMEHFVTGTTARTAASLVGVNKNTAMYYFQPLREDIDLATEDSLPSRARSKWMRAISMARARASEDVGQQGKCLYLAC